MGHLATSQVTSSSVSIVTSGVEVVCRRTAGHVAKKKKKKLYHEAYFKMINAQKKPEDYENMTCAQKTVISSELYLIFNNQPAFVYGGFDVSSFAESNKVSVYSSLISFNPIQGYMKQKYFRKA